jgi:hypothetical protein
MMRACLVSGPAADLDDAGADRWREAGLAVFRGVDRAVAFGLDLGLVMGLSELMRRHPPHHLSPAQAITRQGRTLKPSQTAPSHHSNAPFKPESQSILSKEMLIFWGERFGDH